MRLTLTFCMVKHYSFDVWIKKVIHGETLQKFFEDFRRGYGETLQFCMVKHYSYLYTPIYKIL